MTKPLKKEARNAKAEENPEDLERQRLKKIAFRRGILSQSRANPTRPLQPCKPIVKSDGKDIVKKGHRKNKYLFAFPCLVAPVSGGKMGELIHLDTKNPILYVDFPQGRLKFFGTIIYPKNKYLTLQFPRASGNIVCEDSFDSMVVFSDVWWIGTKEQNPEELRLDFPNELSQEKHAEFDFKGGAGIVSGQKDSASPKPPSKECDEPVTNDTDSELDALQDTEAVKPHSTKSTPNRSKEESKTPVRSSSRTAGKTYKFVDSPSEDDLSSTRSDSSSSDLEEMPKAKKQKVSRNLGNMLEEAAKDSVPILPNSGNDKINEVLASDIQNASTSASKTPSRRKTKASATQSASVATTGTLVQSSLSSFLHQSEEKKSQNEKTPLEAKGSTQRKQSTDVKGKAKKNKAADENLSDDEKSQNEKTPLEAKGSSQRKQPTDVKRKAKKNKAASENLSDDEKSQNEKSPLEAKGSTQRKQSTDVKGKGKKNKAADENLSDDEKSQNEKTPLEAKGSTQRRRSTDVKGKAKKNKAADENLSDDDIVEEVQATSKQSGRRKSGRGESASRANQPKAKQKSYDVEELSSGSEEGDDSDEDWTA